MYYGEKKEIGVRRGACTGQSNFPSVQVTLGRPVVLVWCLTLPSVTHLLSSSKDPADVCLLRVFMFLVLWQVKTSVLAHLCCSGSRQSCLLFGVCMKNEGNTETNLWKRFRTGVWCVEETLHFICFFSLVFWTKKRKKKFYINCHLLTAWSELITELVCASISSSV